MTTLPDEGAGRPQPLAGRPELPVLLTITEACNLLRISRWSFYRLVQQRRLRTVKIGARRLVPPAAIADLVTALGEQEEGAA
jgi:excisionase family DNA binding protein